MLTTIGIVTILYLGIVSFVYSFQSGLIFFPRPLLSPQSTLDKFADQTFVISNNEITLHGWLLNPNQPRLLFYYGGNAEEVSLNLPDFQRFKAYTIVLMNYRGYGQSNGEPGEEALFEDALLIYDQVLNQMPQKPESIVLFGRSLGSGVATYVASKRAVNKVILVTPFDSIREIAKSQFPFLPVSLLLKHPFNSSEYAKAINAPVLILQAERDQVIPAKHTKALAEQFGSNCQSILIEQTNHNTIQNSRKYWQALEEFLKVD